MARSSAKLAAIAQGLTFAHADNHPIALRQFRGAVQTYLENKKGLIPEGNCALALSNLFKTIRKSDSDNFETNAIAQLQDDMYRKLAVELALAAVALPDLAGILKQVQEK